MKNLSIKSDDQIEKKDEWCAGLLMHANSEIVLTLPSKLIVCNLDSEL